MDGNIVVNAWKSIDKHMFTLVLGANMQDNKEDNKSFSATGFLSDKLTNLDLPCNTGRVRNPEDRYPRTG